MMNATAAGVAPARVKLGAYVTLWTILTTFLLCGAASLWGAGLQADYGSTRLVADPLMLSVLLAWLFWALRHAFSRYRVLRRLAATLEDLFLSTAQVTVVAAVSGLSIYLAAKAGATLPMRDDTLERLDSLLGFDWRAVAHWLESRPALDAILLRAYNSLALQISFVMLLGSALHPGQRNKEFVSTFLVSVIFTSAIFAFVPAIGMFGKLDEDTLDRLMDIRAGQSIMTYDCAIGIVAFPSYHTVLAIIISYSARHRYWSLIPALLVNIVMLAATSPEGGHYLVDMLAGAVVAVASILIVRRCFTYSVARRKPAGRTARLERPIECAGDLLPLPSSKRASARCLPEKLTLNVYR